MKTRFLFDISSNFRLRYYEIFIPLFVLSLNLKENATDISVTIELKITNKKKLINEPLSNKGFVNKSTKSKDEIEL